MKNGNYYLGLDIGTDSVGYAVTDINYQLLKFKGNAMWGITLFDKAELNTERRSFRSARRRLDRRQHRIQLLQDLFAHEIAKTDPQFFKRLQASALCRDDTTFTGTLFDGKEYTDAMYHHNYPTIHHLIDELMTSEEKHDVRLVYIACAWLVAHRGHFLNEINQNHIADLTNFSGVYEDFIQCLTDRDDAVVIPWSKNGKDVFAEILPKKLSVNVKNKELCEQLFENGKPPKQDATASFPVRCDLLLKLLCGSKISAKELFDKEEYAEIDSFSLSMDDDLLDDILSKLGDDADLILKCKAIFDWALLVDILGGQTSISKAKIDVYDRHEKDLKNLRNLVRKYLPGEYNEIFRVKSVADGKSETNVPNYAAYSFHLQGKYKKDIKKATKTDFSDFLKKRFKSVIPGEVDKPVFDDMMRRLDSQSFLPKQKNSDNRVIPHQLYGAELDEILRHAENYLPFLKERDEDGISVSEKIRSVFLFRVPYFVGPLNASSPNAWLKRKAEGKIYPWNFENMVDFDTSEQAFINRMTNTCEYIPGEPVLPRDSLLYHRFTVLNEINKIQVNDRPLTVVQKQDLYENLFLNSRKVTRKRLENWLLTNHVMEPGEVVSGIDETIHSDLRPQHDFRRFLDDQILTGQEVEHIIRHSVCTTDKLRFRNWLHQNYRSLSDEDVTYISKLGYREFGRLSESFLNGLEGVSKETGETYTILSALWNTNCNLMELLSDRYTFRENIEAIRRDYYRENPVSLEERLNEMYISNAVKRPVLRSLEIVKEVVKAQGTPPAKIFVEMVRGAKPEQKNKRTVPRKQQILALYQQCKEEDVRELKQQLEELGEAADSRLQSDRLFLYYIQLGRCLYTNERIDVTTLGSQYNIEHIYPQAFVKDDSILNNEILVRSEVNGEKQDTYPVSVAIQQKMGAFWRILLEKKMMTEEKYKRLTRTTPFTDDERMGFINRQLTETSQSTKAVATLLKERYPDTRIVYVKARLTSEFRQEYNLLKSRTVNDLHHAKDAYLNIVTGNVYDMRFSQRWFCVHDKYSLKTKTLFGSKLVLGGEVVWDGSSSLDMVKKTVAKNNVRLSTYTYCKHHGQNGGFFDQNPIKAGSGLIPRKAGLPTEKYGGYRGATISYFIPVRYSVGKKSDIIVMPVELVLEQNFRKDAEAYAKERISRILGKSVDYVSFPLGMRPWKINTILSLDGFRVRLAGSSNKGKCIIAAPFMMFCTNRETETYMKHLENLAKKTDNNPNYVYDAQYDMVTKEQNLSLYDCYIEKLTSSIYVKRPGASPLGILIEKRNYFMALPVIVQAKALLSIHCIFGRDSNGCDLSLIEGTPRAAATVGFSSTMSNWKKNYKDVRVVDISTSGLWEKQSGNLLDLLETS